MGAPKASGKRASGKAGSKISTSGTTVRLKGKQPSRGNKGSKS